MKEAVRSEKIALWRDQRESSFKKAIVQGAGVLLCNVAYRVGQSVENVSPALETTMAYVPAVGALALAVKTAFDAVNFSQADGAIKTLEDHKDGTYNALYAAKEPTPPTSD